MADCERPHMRLFLMGFALLVAVMFDGAGHTVQAQPYCAMYDNGTRDCAIPTLSSCEQSVSGVGGYCAPDTTSQLRPNLIDRLRAEQMGQDDMSPPPEDNPRNDPNWMPPRLASSAALPFRSSGPPLKRRRGDHAGCGLVNGKVKRNTAPPPSLFSAQILPP